MVQLPSLLDLIRSLLLANSGLHLQFRALLPMVSLSSRAVQSLLVCWLSNLPPTKSAPLLPLMLIDWGLQAGLGSSALAQDVL